MRVKIENNEGTFILAGFVTTKTGLTEAVVVNEFNEFIKVSITRCTYVPETGEQEQEPEREGVSLKTIRVVIVEGLQAVMDAEAFKLIEPRTKIDTVLTVSQMQLLTNILNNSDYVSIAVEDVDTIELMSDANISIFAERLFNACVE